MSGRVVCPLCPYILEPKWLLLHGLLVDHKSQSSFIYVISYFALQICWFDLSCPHSHHPRCGWQLTLEEMEELWKAM